MAHAFALANIGGAGLPSMPSSNMLGGWSARSTNNSGASGTLGLVDLSGHGNSMGSFSGTNPLVLTSSDPVCGGSPTVHSTLAGAGGLAAIASFSTPITVYFVGYTTAANGDLFLIGSTIARCFIGLVGAAETFFFRVPGAGNQASDGSAQVNTTASIGCCTIPVSAGTFNSYLGQSTPATGTVTAGTIPTAQTAVGICAQGGNIAGMLAELYIYSGSDAQATRLANMNVLATRCNLPKILS